MTGVHRGTGRDSRVVDKSAPLTPRLNTSDALHLKRPRVTWSRQKYGVSLRLPPPLSSHASLKGVVCLRRGAEPAGGSVSRRPCRKTKQNKASRQPTGIRCHGDAHRRPRGSLYNGCNRLSLGVCSRNREGTVPQWYCFQCSQDASLSPPPLPSPLGDFCKMAVRWKRDT